jgi:endonuclease/exonuclease/phosphatase family metal-dependent hydrolase
VTVASYNVHRCIGIDGRYDPERIAAVLGEVDADVVGLQEVDTHRDARGHLDQLDLLARLTGLTGVAGPTLLHARGRFGNAVLTRWRILAARRHDLSLPAREPRGAVDVDVAPPGSRVLRVIATHLGLRPGDRRFQVWRLLRAIGDDRDTPIVLLGDFNEWRPGASALRRLRARFGRSRAVRTFPSRRPLLALDRIWAQPASALRDVGVHRSPLAQVASDHLPVRATLVLP